MPDNQRQLRDLLPFLAELHKRRLAAVGVQQFRNPDENLAILLADCAVHHRGATVHRAIAVHGPCARLRRVSASPGHGDAVVVLLLSSGGSSSGGLDLGMLLGEMLLLGLMRVLLGLVLLVLVLQPRRISLGVLVLVGEDMLGLRLEHCGQRAGGRERQSRALGRGLRDRRSGREEIALGKGEIVRR